MFGSSTVGRQFKIKLLSWLLYYTESGKCPEEGDRHTNGKLLIYIQSALKKLILNLFFINTFLLNRFGVFSLKFCNLF